jgi:hypothetical protein
MQDLHAAPAVCREQRESIVDMLEELLETLPGQMLAASPDALLHGIKYNEAGFSRQYPGLTMSDSTVILYPSHRAGKHLSLLLTQSVSMFPQIRTSSSFCFDELITLPHLIVLLDSP